jgi:hypothetical protein
MICPPCRVAGDMNKELVTDAHAADADSIRQLIVEEHNVCKGGTWCDCQHKTGKVINEHSNS